MPQDTIKLPSDFFEKRSLERSLKPLIHRNTHPEKKAVPFLHPAHKRLIIILFLIALYFSSSLTWFTLVTFEKAVTRVSHLLAANIAEPPATSTSSYDFSSITFTANGQLDAILTTPDNFRIGRKDGQNISPLETVTFEEGAYIRETLVSTQAESGNRWRFKLDKPKNGIYTITLYPITTRDHSFSLDIDSRSSLYTQPFAKKLYLTENQSVSFDLYFDKDAINQVKLVSQQPITGFLREIFARLHLIF